MHIRVLASQRRNTVQLNVLCKSFPVSSRSSGASTSTGLLHPQIHNFPFSSTHSNRSLCTRADHNSNFVESQSAMRLAILNCPGSERYDTCFKRWIGEYTEKPVDWHVFEVADGELPDFDMQFSGYIITGSRHGVYEDFPWIQQLCSWVATAHRKKEKLLGICFGHQAVAQALGGTVVINPAGFEIGRFRTNVSPAAVEYFERLGTWDNSKFGVNPQLTMNFVHGDYVTMDGVPSELVSMGGTALSPHNGLFNGSNILTFQGHPEFITANVLKCKEKLVEKGVLPDRLPPGADLATMEATLPGPVDSDWIAQTALRFFEDIESEEETDSFGKHPQEEDN